MTLFDRFESLRAGLKANVDPGSVLDEHDYITLRIGFFAGLQTMLKRLQEGATPEEIHAELNDLKADIEADVTIDPDEEEGI